MRAIDVTLVEKRAIYNDYKENKMSKEELAVKYCRSFDTIRKSIWSYEFILTNSVNTNSFTKEEIEHIEKQNTKEVNIEDSIKGIKYSLNPNERRLTDEECIRMFN